MSNTLELPSRYHLEVERILGEKAPGIEVWAYGSRVDGTNDETSDLDLVLRAPGLNPLPIRQFHTIRNAFEESRLPIIVDIHDWARLPESFQEEIVRNYLTLVAAD